MYIVEKIHLIKCIILLNTKVIMHIQVQLSRIPNMIKTLSSGVSCSV